MTTYGGVEARLHNSWPVIHIRQWIKPLNLFDDILNWKTQYKWHRLSKNIFQLNPFSPWFVPYFSSRNFLNSLSFQVETSQFPSVYGSISSLLVLIKHLSTQWMTGRTQNSFLGLYSYLRRLPSSHGWNLILYKAHVAGCQANRENIAIKPYKTRQSSFRLYWYCKSCYRTWALIPSLLLCR